MNTVANLAAPPGVATDLVHSEQVYRRLVGANPRHVEAWFQLGLVLLRQARHRPSGDFSQFGFS